MDMWGCIILSFVMVIVGAGVFGGIVGRATGSSPRHHIGGDDQ